MWKGKEMSSAVLRSRGTGTRGPEGSECLKLGENMAGGFQKRKGQWSRSVLTSDQRSESNGCVPYIIEQDFRLWT